MFAATDKAQDHINMESYIIEDDAVGQAFADLLLVQQRRGVQVNLMYDSVGGFNTPRPFFDRLRQTGVAVLEFNPVNPLTARGHWQLNNRDHRKLLIVDGRTVFLGGINISGVYSSGSIFRRSGKNRPSPAAPGATPTCRLRARGGGVSKALPANPDKQHGPTLAAKNYFPTLIESGRDIAAIGQYTRRPRQPDLPDADFSYHPSRETGVPDQCLFCTRHATAAGAL